MRVESSRFGPKEAGEAELYTAPEGLPGIGGHLFLLIAPKGMEHAFWLQSVEDPTQAIVLLDPKLLDPSYQPSPTSVATTLGVADAELLLRVVVWPADEEGKLYANLFAPVWLAPSGRNLAQTLMVGSGQAVRAIFELPAAG